jgi:hypothetical protein
MPNIASLSPQATAACGTPLTVVINGTGFTPNSGVLLNGSSLITVSYSYVSPTELTVAIPAADVNGQGVGITVANPPPPGTSPNESLLRYESSSTLYLTCTALVSIDAASPALATVDRDVFGVNLTAAMDLTNSSANYNTIMSTFRSASFGMARWPLAALSDYYHWQTNSFSSCAAAYGPASRTTFDQFMQQVAMPLGLDVNITVNYGSNGDCSGGADPNEAAAWVDYANNQMHYGIKYWTIGNEQYYGSPTLGATVTTPDFNVLPSEPGSDGSTTYASRVATQFYPLMKAKDPTIQDWR